MKNTISCSECGNTVSVYRNPIPTADVIIRVDKGVVLIKRKNPPHGWALPGGFIDYGESAEHAAVREAAEETSLEVKDLALFGVYSDPERDPRHHTLTVVFTARGVGNPAASDDADDLGVFRKDNLPKPLAFDHSVILDDYFKSLEDSHSK